MSASPVPLRLFIVDDEPAICHGLEELFPWNEWGFVIAGLFSNGRQALDALRLQRAHVVLTDIRMPIMDGLTLAQHIQAEGLPVHPVFLSAYADFEYARKGLLYGVRDFIVKPVEYAVLEETFTTLSRTLATAHGAVSETAVQNNLKDTVNAYIDAHLADATLEGAALAAGMTTQSLSRMYKRLSGATFAQTVHLTRMRRAGELVRSVNVRFFNVAQALGYDNAKNFTRAFRSHYGITPSEYRKTDPSKT